MQSRDLDSFIKNNKKFIKLNDGESFEGTFKGVAIGISRFNPDKEVVIYKFTQPGSETVLSWENTSVKVAEEMKTKVPVGENCKITRKGSTAKDTSYIIEKTIPF